MWGVGNQDRQEEPEHPDGNDHDMEEDKESPSGTDKQKEEEVETVMLARCMPAAECPPSAIIKEMERMIIRLGFSQTLAQKLVENERIGSPWA